MKTTKLTLSLAALLAAGSASAQYTVQVGVGAIDPRATSDDMTGTLAGSSLAALPGNKIEIQKQTTLLLTIERALDDNFGVELVLGAPPKHDVKFRVGDKAKTYAALYKSNPTAYASLAGAAHVAAYDGKTIATVTQFAPTVFLNYKFFDKGSKLRPFVGVGVNYTIFRSETNANGDALINSSDVKVKVTDSFGLAFHTGVTYKFDDKWSANVGWSTAAVKNAVEITANNNTLVNTTYRFHPSVFSATVGYSF
jgi:outer membrane protein